MKRKLEHTFITKAHNLINLFQGVKKFSTFMARLEEQAQIDPERYDINKYVGDGFEFFVELFLYLHPCDNRVGVYDYQPMQENDNGVDGIGVNIRGEKCVVQIKYRTQTDGFLQGSADHLANLFSDGDNAYEVVVDHKRKNDKIKNYRHFIFTTASGLNFYTDQEFFKSNVRCFGYEDFRALLDNNVVFWRTALEIVNILRKDSNNSETKSV